jgi:sulfatase modifying factor 1
MTNEDSTKKSKRTCSRKKCGCTFLAGIIFAILLFIAINVAMELVSKSEYCGTACHEMATAYQTWELSPHGTNSHGVRIDCIDCHLIPKEHFFRHVIGKAKAGAKDTYKHYFGPEYDGDKMQKKVREHFSNDTCLHCHEDLLVTFSSSAAQSAHNGLMNRPDAPENRCVHCHEGIGHQRNSKLFSE